MEKQLEQKVGVTVFFEKNINQKQIDDIGNQIKKDKRVKSIKFTSADKAWKDFKKDYFKDDPELADGFKENPLADSSSYTVYLKNIKTQEKVAKEIKKIKGVRKVKHSQKTRRTLASL